MFRDSAKERMMMNPTTAVTIAAAVHPMEILNWALAALLSSFSESEDYNGRVETHAQTHTHKYL